jgi:hypothetical protein
MNEKHQLALMNLQSQISADMAIGEPEEEEEDMFTIEYEIETDKAAIEKVQSASPPSAPVFAASTEEFNQTIKSLEDRVSVDSATAKIRIKSTPISGNQQGWPRKMPTKNEKSPPFITDLKLL